MNFVIRINMMQQIATLIQFHHILHHHLIYATLLPRVMLKINALALSSIFLPSLNCLFSISWTYSRLFILAHANQTSSHSVPLFSPCPYTMLLFPPYALVLPPCLHLRGAAPDAVSAALNWFESGGSESADAAELERQIQELRTKLQAL